MKFKNPNNKVEYRILDNRVKKDFPMIEWNEFPNDMVEINNF